MKKFFEDISAFLISSLAFFSICLVLVILFDKSDLHLFVNQFHSLLSDTFFKYYTHIGDGIFPAIAMPIVLVVYRKDVLINFLLAAVTFILVPANVQFFKRIVFPKTPRPVRFFGEEALYLVPDVEMAHIHSFPSGHATTFFALFILLAYIFRENRRLQIACALGAMIGAFSRVYLSQHFLQDILAGGVLGVTCFVVARWILTYPIAKLQK